MRWQQENTCRVHCVDPSRWSSPCLQVLRLDAKQPISVDRHGSRRVFLCNAHARGVKSTTDLVNQILVRDWSQVSVRCGVFTPATCSRSTACAPQCNISPFISPIIITNFFRLQAKNSTFFWRLSQVAFPFDAYNYHIWKTLQEKVQLNLHRKSLTFGRAPKKVKHKIL